MREERGYREFVSAFAGMVIMSGGNWHDYRTGFISSTPGVRCGLAREDDVCHIRRESVSWASQIPNGPPQAENARPYRRSIGAGTLDSRRRRHASNPSHVRGR